MVFREYWKDKNCLFFYGNRTFSEITTYAGGLGGLAGDAIRTDDWEAILEELQIGRASFYAMHNKLLGGGLISKRIKNTGFQVGFQRSSGYGSLVVDCSY
jgi:hypothetical protein